MSAQRILTRNIIEVELKLKKERERETERGENVYFWFVIFFFKCLFFFNLIFKYSFDRYLSRAVINLTVELSKSKLKSYEHGLNFTHKMQNHDSFFLKRGYEH